MRVLLQFAFVTFSLATLVFLYIEWQVPGFVSFVFPFYWFVIVDLLLGFLIAFLSPLQEAPTSRRLESVAVVIAGVLLALVILKDGDVFGVMRWPLAIVGLLVPTVLVKSSSVPDPE